MRQWEMRRWVVVRLTDYKILFRTKSDFYDIIAS